MMPIATILVATDFSPDGNNALRRAALLARQLDARLTLLHVVDAAGFKPLREWFSRPLDIDLKAAQARATLRRFCAEIAGRHDVSCTVEVRVGDPHEQLLAASAKADLLVLGQRGRNPLKSLVIGGTTDRMLRTSRTPVLVVKRNADGFYRRALVPVDLTPHGDAAVQVAAAVAPNAVIEVFHGLDSAREAVLREADVTQAILRQARARDEARVHARMRRSVARVGLDGGRVKFSLTHGTPVPSTLHKLRALGADLVVVGKHGESAVADFLLGSVSRRLLAKADCDTLIVPRATRVLWPVRRSPFAQGHFTAAVEQPGSVT
ncbi:MAG: universal stress protein [Burkholderiaceae bacterium]|nr:universal stress protein [Burkholderiaceae bacterium]